MASPSVEQANATRERQILTQAMLDRQDWENEWRDLANYILPRRYSWLINGATNGTSTSDRSRGRYILDGTGTKAARTCAAGMMNGITSPARPWINFRIPGVDEDDAEVGLYLDEVKKVVMRIMAESNFYNALAVFYLDLVVFGTATCLIYEDYEEVIRCYNSPLGEFALIPDESLRIGGFAREFEMTIKQAGDKWGKENLSDTSKAAYEEAKATSMRKITICHLIEKNHPKSGLPKAFKYAEYYWEKGAPAGKFLKKSGYYSKPLAAVRWEVNGTDTYGVGPGHDAIADIIQLQHQTKRKAQGIDKQVNPPLAVDISLSHRPVANLPGGITFVSGNSGGISPAYTVNLNLQDLKEDMMLTQGRIRETFYNDLFKMISQLDTVRSATEIDARREEKLVLLGPVLERVENEGLEVFVRRIIDIADRTGLLPPRPQAIQNMELQIEFVSILADAQRAITTVGVERFLQFVANVAGIWPYAVDLPNFEEIIRNYGKAMGLAGKDLKTMEEFAQSMKAKQQQEQMAQTAALGEQVSKGASQLSQADVGGGVNALQMMLGGG